tara:strand:+ start:161 stop:658 length:498 start_codon:yes stop_codon:yes gene_type:complete
MKHIFITGALLFSFATISAQAVKPGTSNEKPVIVNKEINKEKPVIKKSARPNSTLVKEEKPNTNRSARPNSTLEKEEKTNTNRSAQTNTLVKEKPNSMVRLKPAPEGSANIEFCKGWKDGYIKGWNLNKKEFEKPMIPNCQTTLICEDYKCGYKMGMKQAQIDRR